MSVAPTGPDCATGAQPVPESATYRPRRLQAEAAGIGTGPGDARQRLPGRRQPRRRQAEAAGIGTGPGDARQRLPEGSGERCYWSISGICFRAENWSKSMTAPNGKAPSAPKSSLELEPSASLPDPEVVEKAKRRSYSIRYKLNILEQTDQLQPGEIGALLRREGLYWSHLSNWRRQRIEGTLTAGRKMGRKEISVEEKLTRRVAQLEREKAALQRQLDQVDLIVQVQKKALLLCELHVQDNRSSK